MSQSSPEGIILGKGSTLTSAKLIVDKKIVLDLKPKEKSYSEEEVLNILIDFHFKTDIQHKYNPVCIANWFEQFKKK